MDTLFNLLSALVICLKTNFLIYLILFRTLNDKKKISYFLLYRDIILIYFLFIYKHSLGIVDLQFKFKLMKYLTYALCTIYLRNEKEKSFFLTPPHFIKLWIKAEIMNFL